MNNGRLIVFEGIDGAGKSLQINMLKDRLIKDGVKVHVTAEPTSSVSGGLLRDALSGEAKRSAGEMAALFLLDRIHHNVNPTDGIAKLIAEDYIILCDRYYYSSIAYQGSEIDPEWVTAINLFCPEIRRPDACIFLDISPKKSLERISKNRNSKEIYENLEKLEECRKKYIKTFKSFKDKEKIFTVNADKKPEKIANEIYRIISDIIVFG